MLGQTADNSELAVDRQLRTTAAAAAAAAVA